MNQGVRKDAYNLRRYTMREFFTFTPKQPFLSLSTHFSPSDKRSALQLSPIELFLEPDLYQIQPNGAHFSVFRNDISPFSVN